MAEDPKQGFFSWIVSLFIGGNDPEREKRRLLRHLGRELQKLRFKFYKPREEMVTPGLAKFLFEIYKVTASANQLTVGSDTSQVLKEITIDFHLAEEQRRLRDSFNEASIRDLGKTMDPKFLAQRLKDDLVNFMSSFDATSVKRSNASYNSIMRFVNFVRFDFYFTLKKFDSSLIEGDVTGNPRFETINSNYVVDDLKDFLEVAIPLAQEGNWEPAFEILKAYKGVELVNRQSWARMLQILRNVLGSEVLQLMVQHASGDPYWKPQIQVPNERILESYLSKLKTQTEGIITRIAAEKRDAKIDQLVRAVFGGPVNPRTKYYTDRANQSFNRRVGAQYSYTLPMNYLKAFLLDFFKKDVRELADLLLVRGQWTTNVLSQQMSDYYYQVLNIADALLLFDDSLADEGDLGSKMKRLQLRVVERDEASARPVRTMIEEINAKAKTIIGDAAGSLINFGRGLKSLVEDYERVDHELIINWKELNGLSEQPLNARMSEVYKVLYYFIQLLQIYSKGGTGKGAEESGESAAAVQAAAEAVDAQDEE